MSEESIKTQVTSETRFAPRLTYIYNGGIRAKFKGNCLIQDNLSFTHRYVLNLFIAYKLDTWPRHLSTNFAIGDCLFGAIKLTKNDDGYGIGFDARPQLLLSNDK